MEQKVEKLKEIVISLIVELEKAEVLLKICQNNSLEVMELNIISEITHSIIHLSSKIAEDIELTLIQE